MFDLLPELNPCQWHARILQTAGLSSNHVLVSDVLREYERREKELFTIPEHLNVSLRVLWN